MAAGIERARRLFTVDEYDRMAEVGVLRPEERLELIHGEVVEMSPIDDPHAACVANLTRLLVLGVRERAVVWPQNPVRVEQHSKPQPDLALLAPRSYIKRGTGPSTSDAMLVVEVADTSLHYDRTVKQRLYAQAGIGEYWIVDVGAESVEVYRTPGPDGYRESQRVSRDGVISPLPFPDVHIAIALLFA